MNITPVCAAAAFLVLAACHAAAVVPPVIVAFGDSTTAPRGKTPVYAALLADELSFAGGAVQVINAGIGGNTTQNAQDRFEKDVLSRQPDVVVMQFGINDSAVDVWKKPPAAGPRVSLAHYRSHLRQMVRALKQRGARVVLMTPNPITWTDALRKLYNSAPYIPDDPDGMNVLLRGYADAVRQLAAEEGVGCVDIYAAFQKAASMPSTKAAGLTSDGMHPNSDGHRLVGQLLMDHLASADPRFTRKPASAQGQPGGR